MPLRKRIQVLVCVVFLAVCAASAGEKYSGMAIQQSDTAGSEDMFDSFLENLIGKIQSNIEQTLSQKAATDSEGDDRFEVFDSLDVIAGDILVAAGEIAERDIFLKDGTLTVEGVLRGNASVLRGSIVVKDGGRITGNAHSIGGTVIREKNGVVEGEIRESSSYRNGFVKRRFARQTSYVFAPRWLHENLSSDNFVFRYNRVEGVYLGLAADKKFYWDGHRIFSGYGSLGYGFLTHRWRAQLGLDRQFAGTAGIFELGAEGHNLTDSKDDWIIGQGENTAAAFFLREDYRDYFQRTGFSGHGAWYTKAPGLATMINAEYRYDHYESLYTNAQWSLFKNRNEFRDNPSINDGTMRSIAITCGVSTVEKKRRSTVGWDTYVQAEFGNHESQTAFMSDYMPRTEPDFMRAVVDVRRYQPLSKYNSLALRVRLGSLKGDYIVQKGFELGGVNTLPAFGFKEFAGNRMVLANIEHALNGSVFSDVGFWPGFLTLLVFADAGEVRFTDVKAGVTEGFADFALSTMKSDIGFALGWHDGSARLGFAWRTDTGGPPMVFLRLSKPF